MSHLLIYALEFHCGLCELDKEESCQEVCLLSTVVRDDLAVYPILSSSLWLLKIILRGWQIAHVSVPHGNTQVSFPDFYYHAHWEVAMVEQVIGLLAMVWETWIEFPVFWFWLGPVLTYRYSQSESAESDCLCLCICLSLCFSSKN